MLLSWFPKGLCICQERALPREILPLINTWSNPYSVPLALDKKMWLCVRYSFKDTRVPGFQTVSTVFALSLAALIDSMGSKRKAFVKIYAIDAL
jgi:hypothetical protein